jgi:hypothetical protein
MNLFRNRKIVLLVVVLMLGVILAPNVHAMKMHHDSMEMSDCSLTAHCQSCGNPLPSSTRIDSSLPPSLGVVVSVFMHEATGPAESLYHPPR